MPAYTQAGSTPLTAAQAQDDAIRIVCAKNIHQSLWLPANELHESLRVTFGTTSNFSDSTLPVILFCPPMFGGRWLVMHLDHLAQQTGVRMICADRPGMGGSTSVSPGIRVKVWLETVPVLLKHVGVSRVSIVCHSAGTIYALNALYHFRDILEPRAPYIALVAPWVDNAHSQTTLMNIASMLPVGMVDKLSVVNKFVDKRIMPVTSWSGGMISSTMNIFRAENGASDSDSVSSGEMYGVDNEVGQHIERLSKQYFMTEDIIAGNEDAKLCLKKTGAGIWEICDDYLEYAKLIEDREKQRLDSELDNESKIRLRLQVYFAESDVIIGKRGQRYFNECWQQDINHVDFETKELPDTDHDSVLIDHKKGALRSIFEQIHKLNTK